MDAIGQFLSSNSGTLGGLVGTGAQLYGQQNAAEAVTNAATSGMNTATSYLGNVNSIWNPQQSLGAGADTALGSTLGTNGQPANYSNFLNMPGYQFAVNQGTQAIQRQAAANGSAYTPNTAEAVGQYVTGTAMQDYNTYVNQLYQAAGLGSTANTALTGANMTTAGNIENLGLQSGAAQAGMYNSMGQTVGGALGAGGLFAGSGVNAAGGLAGSVIGGIGNILGGGSSGSNPAGYGTGSNGAPVASGAGYVTGGGSYGSDYSPYVSQPGSGVDPITGQPIASTGGTPTFDPSLGGTIPSYSNMMTPQMAYTPGNYNNPG
jgi:hypothetical protein